MQLFFALVLTHFIADFMLQGNTIGFKKYGLNRYMLTHVATITLTSLLPLLLFQVRMEAITPILLVIFLTHLTIDCVRSFANRHLHITPDKYSFWVSLGLDQILHVSVLYLLVSMI